MQDQKRARAPAYAIFRLPMALANTNRLYMLSIAVAVFTPHLGVIRAQIDREKLAGLRDGNRCGGAREMRRTNCNCNFYVIQKIGAAFSYIARCK